MMRDWLFFAGMLIAAVGLGAILRDQYVHRRAQRLVRKAKLQQLKASCPNCRHYDSPCDIHKER